MEKMDSRLPLDSARDKRGNDRNGRKSARVRGEPALRIDAVVSSRPPGAVGALAIESNVVVVEPKSHWKEFLEIPKATVQMKDLVAHPALKMMVVLHFGQLISWRLPR